MRTKAKVVLAALAAWGGIGGMAMAQAVWQGSQPPTGQYPPAAQAPSPQYPQNPQYPAAGQPGDPRYPGVMPQNPIRPDQPVVPQYPTIERRQPPGPAVAPQPGTPSQPGNAAQPGTPRPMVPFVLTAAEQAQLDRVLAAWEEASGKFRTFDCRFTRWQYDSVFSDDPNKPKSIDKGELNYAAPDRGRFEIKGERAEAWICDGKSIFEVNFAKKVLTEYPLPPECQGKAIANSPLPFLFGTEAQKLKQRYFLRIITPKDVQDEIWLEAHPRFQADRANYAKAELILQATKMLPSALQTYATNGKDRTVYKFDDIVLNARGGLFTPDVFRFRLPPFGGWKKVVEQPPPSSSPSPTLQGQRPAGLSR